MAVAQVKKADFVMVLDTYLAGLLSLQLCVCYSCSLTNTVYFIQTLFQTVEARH